MAVPDRRANPGQCRTCGLSRERGGRDRHALDVARELRVILIQPIFGARLVDEVLKDVLADASSLRLLAEDLFLGATFDHLHLFERQLEGDFGFAARTLRVAHPGHVLARPGDGLDQHDKRQGRGLEREPRVPDALAQRARPGLTGHQHVLSTPDHVHVPVAVAVGEERLVLAVQREIEESVLLVLDELERDDLVGLLVGGKLEEVGCPLLEPLCTLHHARAGVAVMEGAADPLAQQRAQECGNHGPLAVVPHHLDEVVRAHQNGPEEDVDGRDALGVVAVVDVKVLNLLNEVGEHPRELTQEGQDDVAVHLGLSLSAALELADILRVLDEEVFEMVELLGLEDLVLVGAVAIQGGLVELHDRDELADALDVGEAAGGGVLVEELRERERRAGVGARWHGARHLRRSIRSRLTEGEGWA